MREEAKKWLEQAEEDLKTARDTFLTGHYYAVAFWAEQSPEKALDSLLINKGIAVRTHYLNELAELIHQELGISVNEILEDVNKLTVHYTVSRYPDVANGVPARLYSKSDAEELIKRAEISWVKQNLQ